MANRMISLIISSTMDPCILRSTIKFYHNVLNICKLNLFNLNTCLFWSVQTGFTLHGMCLHTCSYEHHALISPLGNGTYYRCLATMDFSEKYCIECKILSNINDSMFIKDLPRRLQYDVTFLQIEINDNIFVFQMKISNLVCMTLFQNNLHQVRSKSKDQKAK